MAKNITTDSRRQMKQGRFYQIDGVGLLPSVTTILKVISKGEALNNWIAKVEREMVIKVSGDLYEDIAGTAKMSRAAWALTMNNRLGKERAMSREIAKAAEIGSQVHALIEWTMKAELMHDAGPSPRISDKAQWAFMAWEDWRKSVNLKPLYVEQVVYSTQYGYAGTLDLLAEVDGVLTVIDWKTGKAVYAEAHLQNAAYRQAIREMGHGDPQAGLIVRLPKVERDPEFQVVPAKPEPPMFSKFLDAFSVWKWQEQMDAEREAEKDGEFAPILRESIAAVEARRTA